MKINYLFYTTITFQTIKPIIILTHQWKVNDVLQKIVTSLSYKGMTVEDLNFCHSSLSCVEIPQGLK